MRMCLSNTRNSNSTYFLFSEGQIKSLVIWMFILISQITCRLFQVFSKNAYCTETLKKESSIDYMCQREEGNTVSGHRQKGKMTLLCAALLCTHFPQIYGPWDVAHLQEKSRNSINSKRKSAFRSWIAWEEKHSYRSKYQYMFLFYSFIKYFLTWVQC